MNFTSEEVRSWPLANFRPGLSFTVYSVGEVNVGRLGDVRLDVGAAVRGVQQERVDLVHHGERAVVVRAGRVDRGDLVGGADGERLARGAAAVGRAAAAATGAAGEKECRGPEGPEGEAETAAPAVVQ